MKVALFNVSNNLYEACSLALRRFVGGMDGVESIDVEHGKIAFCVVSGAPFRYVKVSLLLLRA